MRALTPLTVLADNICSGLDDPTGSYKFRILRHLLSVYKELHLYLDHEFEVKTKIMDCGSSINMDSDFVYETKVGLMRNGRTAILTLDRFMPAIDKNQTEMSSYLENIFDGNFTGGLFYPFYNSVIPNLMGYGCNINHRGGFYNVDRKNGIIQLGSLVPDDTKLVVEYKSDGVSDGLKLVPSECEDVLSYGAKARFFEEKRDAYWAKWNEDRYKEKYYMTKRLWNFQSALYIAEVAYNSTSEI